MVDKDKDFYLIKIELGWREILLSEIQNNDFISDLDDLSFINKLKERISNITSHLQENDLLIGTPREFIKSEYNSFDKAAESVEAKIIKIFNHLIGDDFLQFF